MKRGGEEGRKASLVEEIKSVSRLKDLSPKSVIGGSKELAGQLKSDDVKSTQLRRVFGELRNLELKVASEKCVDERDLMRLAVRVHYAASRHRNLKGLSDVFEASLGKMQEAEDFQVLVDIMEAIVAYSRGG